MGGRWTGAVVVVASMGVAAFELAGGCRTDAGGDASCDPSCDGAAASDSAAVDGAPGGDADASSDGGGTSCVTLGQPCAASAECCSFVCDGSCVPGACLPDLAPCNLDGAPCCNLSCDPGTHACAEGGMACKTIGNPCLSDPECCTMHCDPDSGTCQP